MRSRHSRWKVRSPRSHGSVQSVSCEDIALETWRAANCFPVGSGSYRSLPLTLEILPLELSDKLVQETGNSNASIANTLTDFYIFSSLSTQIGNVCPLASFDWVKSKGLLSTKLTD